MSTSRVAVVDDHEIIAQALAAVLGRHGHDVVRVEPDGGDLVAAVVALSPDLVLLDLDLGAMGDGADAVAPLVAGGLDVLVLTGVTDRRRRAHCLREGAHAVIGKHTSFDELQDAVLTLLDGGAVTTPHEREEELAWLRDEQAQRQRLLHGFTDLSSREAEVLGALMDGLQVDEIARRAVVAPSTVRSQVRAILRKLDVGSQLAAVARARSAGWEPPPAAGEGDGGR